MKLIMIGIVIALMGINILCVLKLDQKLQNSRENENKIRRERNMYDSLYRSANTRLYQFQDSINQHCICK